MLRHFEEQLQELLEKVERMGSLAESMISTAIRALVSRDESDYAWIPGGAALCAVEWILKAELAWFWVIAQTIALGAILVSSQGASKAGTLAAVFGAFQAFGLYTSEIAARERRTAQELARLNRELVAAQALLADREDLLCIHGFRRTRRPASRAAGSSRRRARTA